jgi:membrane fusion protein (multidrug efflux system)
LGVWGLMMAVDWLIDPIRSGRVHRPPGFPTSLRRCLTARADRLTSSIFILLRSDPAMSGVISAKRRALGLMASFVVVVVACGVVGFKHLSAATSEEGTAAQLRTYLDQARTHFERAKDFVTSKLESKSEEGEGEEEAERVAHRVVATTPETKDVTLTESYVCQIHSRRHIEVCALEGGYLEEIAVKEGQSVKKGDLMFRILPTLFKAKLDAEVAEAQLAQLEYNNSKALCDRKIVSPNELALVQAKLAKAQAKAQLAKAEMDFTNVRAPFDGIVDRLNLQIGSLIREGDFLTTLSDNSVMWVYFNVPERQYLEYMSSSQQDKDGQQIELQLANHNTFDQPGKIGAIEAKFNNETGNIAFRADFSNPNGLLRHGQTGTILIHNVLNHATVIPQRSTFENLAKRYVYVVDKDDVAHQREITVQHELDDVYVLAPGILKDDEKIVLEGARQIRDGDKVAYDVRDSEDVLAHLKNTAE